MNNTAINSLQPISQNHQFDNSSSANEIYSKEAKPQAKETRLQIENNFSDIWQNKTFSILNHIDKLQPAKGSERYICPVCDGNDLTIEPKTGKYQCWHGCECSEIREALSPWSEIVANTNNGFYPNKKPRFKPKKPTLPFPIPEGKITLATLPEVPTDNPRIVEKPFIPEWATKKYKIPQDCDREIIYQYSKTQWISRYEWSDPTHPKGHKKHPHPKHLDDQGKSRYLKITARLG